jgi:hypothetical protein
MSAGILGREARALAHYLGRRLAPTRANGWTLLRAALAIAFVAFAVITCAGWLRTAVARPFHGERIELRDFYDPSPIEHDLALLRQWLPVEGKIGYLSDLPPFRLGNVRLHLSPLLLDPDWRKYDWVLVDHAVGRFRTEIESPAYEFVAGMVTARAVAGGMQLYRRRSR